MLILLLKSEGHLLTHCLETAYDVNLNASLMLYSNTDLKARSSHATAESGFQQPSFARGQHGSHPASIKWTI
jgi:hypothetical protein